jgi:hypothetical protein
MAGLPITWQDCQSHGRIANHTAGLPITWQDCQSQGRIANHMAGLPITWQDCLSHGRIANHRAGLPITWLGSQPHMAGQPTTWLDSQHKPIHEHRYELGKSCASRAIHPDPPEQKGRRGVGHMCPPKAVSHASTSNNDIFPSALALSARTRRAHSDTQTLGAKALRVARGEASLAPPPHTHSCTPGTHTCMVW